ncbi:T9SS type A sorting domain-containing protein [Putridiphycobacter roseus]|nr:T9SS type A sorting domain-containing protein [Putridiphycobacter roseus]
MKKVILLLFLTTLALNIHAQEQIEINCDSVSGNFKHLHGFLHGEVNLQSKPQALQLVKDGNFKFWRNSNAFDNQVLADSLGFNTSIIISDIYANNQGGYQNAQPWTNFTQYRSFLSTLFTATIGNNLTPHYWDVWNEPQSTEFWTGNFSQLIQTYRNTNQIKDSIAPSMKLVGPSIVSYDELFIQTFLDSLAAHAIYLDAVSWHEFGLPDSLTLHVNQFRTLLQNNPQWGNPEIHINEYSPRQTNQIPAWKVGWFYHLEKSNVDWANNACWDDMDDGVNQWNNCIWGLNGILSYDESSPLPIYWAHKAYGTMQGEKVLSTGTDSKTIAIASIENQSLKILTGRYYAIKTGQMLFQADSNKAIADVSLKITNHPFALNSVQNISIERIPAGDTIFMHSPLPSPITVFNGNLSITSDSINIDLPGYMDGDSYYISINSPLLASEKTIEPKPKSPWVYPNPTHDLIHIIYPYTSAWTLELYTLSGQKIMDIQNPGEQVNLSGINSGIYLLSFQDKDWRSFNLKIIKR